MTNFKRFSSVTSFWLDSNCIKWIMTILWGNYNEMYVLCSIRQIIMSSYLAAERYQNDLWLPDDNPNQSHTHTHTHTHAHRIYVGMVHKHCTLTECTLPKVNWRVLPAPAAKQVCVCVCVYIYIYIYTHTRTHTYMPGSKTTNAPVQCNKYSSVWCTVNTKHCKHEVFSLKCKCKCYVLCKWHQDGLYIDL